MRGNETLAGYGGLGQRPDPGTERGIISTDAFTSGWIFGQVQQGKVKVGITSAIGEQRKALSKRLRSSHRVSGHDDPGLLTKFGR